MRVRSRRSPRVAVVVAEFNSTVTEEMKEKAIAYCRKLGLEPWPVLVVPGSFEIPWAIDQALRNPKVRGAVALGALVQGETAHDEVLGHAIFFELLRISREHGKPVGLGITGPRQSLDQARARVDRAEGAVEAVFRLLKVQEELRRRT